MEPFAGKAAGVKAEEFVKELGDSRDDAYAHQVQYFRFRLSSLFLPHLEQFRK